MNAIQLRIIKRAIKSRMSEGEEFEIIIQDYPRLSETEIEQIKTELGA